MGWVKWERVRERGRSKGEIGREKEAWRTERARRWRRGREEEAWRTERAGRGRRWREEGRTDEFREGKVQ